MKNYTTKQLSEVFKAAETTLFEQSSLTQSQFKSALLPFKKINFQEKEDNDFFWVMVYVTFYSGFKAKTVTDKIPAIKRIFGNYKEVAKFDDEKIQKIIDSKTIIGHKLKIQGIIHNAIEIKAIIKKFGSFKIYLDSFGYPNDDDVLFSLVKDLKKRFKYLGGITVFHFLTDIGFNVLKPDRVLCRICFRLGLVDSEDDLLGVIKAGRKIAAATKQPIRYIDIILVAYGQVDEKKEFGLKYGICLSVNPKCELCGMYDFCIYKGKKNYITAINYQRDYKFVT